MPTSFSGCSYLVLRLIMMFSANRGTPRFFSPFDQIKAVAHIEKSPVSPPFRHYMLEHPWFSFHSGLMTLNYGILGLWTQSGLPVKPCKNVVSLASDTQFITFKGVTQPAAPSGSMDHVLQYRPKTARFQPFYPVYYIQICPRDVRNLTVFAELGVWRWRKTPPALKPAVLWDAQRGAAGTDDVLPVPGQWRWSDPPPVHLVAWTPYETQNSSGIIIADREDVKWCIFKNNSNIWNHQMFAWFSVHMPARSWERGSAYEETSQPCYTCMLLLLAASGKCRSTPASRTHGVAKRLSSQNSSSGHALGSQGREIDGRYTWITAERGSKHRCRNHLTRCRNEKISAAR